VYVSHICIVALSPDERVFYAGAADGKVHPVILAPMVAQVTSGPTVQDTAAWNAHEYVRGIEQTHRLCMSSSAVLSMQVSNDGTRLVTGAADGKALVWDLLSKQTIKSLITLKGIFVHKC